MVCITRTDSLRIWSPNTFSPHADCAVLGSYKALHSTSYFKLCTCCLEMLLPWGCPIKCLIPLLIYTGVTAQVMAEDTPLPLLPESPQSYFYGNFIEMMLSQVILWDQTLLWSQGLWHSTWSNFEDSCCSQVAYSFWCDYSSVILPFYLTTTFIEVTPVV